VKLGRGGFELMGSCPSLPPSECSRIFSQVLISNNIEDVAGELLVGYIASSWFLS